jgi:cytochrome c biogenesis protein CcdA
MNGLSGIGLLTSFGAGVISFLSPCVLPLVPGYVSYVAGEALGVTGEPIRPLAALRLSLCFRARLFDRLRDPGSKRYINRTIAPVLPL